MAFVHEGIKIDYLNNRDTKNTEYEDISWSEIFNMMYNDARYITNPVVNMFEYILPDPNAVDALEAKKNMESRIPVSTNKMTKRFKIGNPDIIRIVNDSTGEATLVPRTQTYKLEQEYSSKNRSGSLPKRSLINPPEYEQANDPEDILETAIDETELVNIKQMTNFTPNINPQNKLSLIHSRTTPSTVIDEGISNSSSPETYKVENNFYSSLRNSSILIPRLSLPQDNIERQKYDDSKIVLDHSKFPNHYLHNYNVNNLTKNIHRTILSPQEEALNLYSKDELEKIQNFVKKTYNLIYEGPLEKKNPWSWGYKLRWVRLAKCEMEYFLSPYEMQQGKNPLGILNFKVAEWSSKVSDKDDKVFFVQARGSNRAYEWKVPKNSQQLRKSWIIRIEKMIKASAFMQQLKGILEIN
ncbi:hypothetical protein cand_013970 [Cryptosporidium andersoni]|uniref:PH domain-containing protein n=1 Tax=Cryptosporidium andersoni TaxID=117008 RepID=A0A1J4MUC3_9CRYT|nr:hypothetical protein cand_013970 [Cryptosporidium andersoni]